jgi:PTS system mannose-specific IIB component
MIVFARVDSRLIHGQVIEAWLPYLKVGRILVADEEAANNPLTRAAMGLALPQRVVVDVVPLSADFSRFEKAPEPTLLLVRDIASFVRVRRQGIACRLLNLGNVHYAPGRSQVTPSVFLSPEEIAVLEAIAQQGVTIEARAVPKEKPLSLPEILARVGAGEHASKA